MSRAWRRLVTAGWRWPNEALGRLAAGVVPDAPRRRVAGATLAEDPRYARLLGRFPNRPAAMTFGSTVVARRTLGAALVAHELTHVAQYRRWGAAYLGLYLVGAAWGWLRHGESYVGNPFEVRAMRAARGQLR